MTTELREKLAALPTLAPSLNETTQRAGTCVEAVETMLGAELKLGISATTNPFDYQELGNDDENRPLRALRFLAYGRLSGRFCIHVVAVTQVGIPDGYGNPDWER